MSRLVAAWLDLGSCRDLFCVSWATFESFVSLGGEPAALLPPLRKVGKSTKNETTWELNWEPFGTHFETVASQNRADKGFIALLCQSFFESVSRSVPKRVFRGNC